MNSASSNFHVMILDDDDIDRQAICRALKDRDDLDITQMASSVDALDVLASGTRLPDVIVTDLFMPGIDGIEFMRTLRDRGPGIPIVVISGQGQRGSLDFLDMAGRLGAAKVIEKRDIASHLPAAINEILDKSPRLKVVP